MISVNPLASVWWLWWRQVDVSVTSLVDSMLFERSVSTWRDVMAMPWRTRDGAACYTGRAARLLRRQGKQPQRNVRGNFCRSRPRCSADVKTSFLEICSFIAWARYVYRHILPGDARCVRYICGWATEEWHCGEQVVTDEQTRSARWPRMHCK